MKVLYYVLIFTVCIDKHNSCFRILVKMFPWSLGANVGLSLTTILTALSSGNVGFVQVAIANLLFNGEFSQ